MAANPHVAGVVIAGGRSIRFGGEKAVATFHGEPLLQRAARRLALACRAVAVNARPDTQAMAFARQLGYEALHAAPGEPDGPLSGVKAGPRCAPAQRARMLAVGPCDG